MKKILPFLFLIACVHLPKADVARELPREDTFNSTYASGRMPGSMVVKTLLGQPLNPGGLTPGVAASVGDLTVLDEVILQRTAGITFATVSAALDSNWAYLTGPGWRINGSTAGTALYLDSGNLELAGGAQVTVGGADPVLYASNTNGTLSFSTNCSNANCAVTDATAGFSFYPQVAFDATDYLFSVGNASRTSIFTVLYGGGVVINGGTAIQKHLSAVASLDFTALAANSCEVLTITVTGAADGDSVTLGVLNALADVDGATERTTFYGWISGANTCSVRRCNVTGTITANPAAANVRCDVWQH